MHSIAYIHKTLPYCFLLRNRPKGIDDKLICSLILAVASWDGCTPFTLSLSFKNIFVAVGRKTSNFIFFITLLEMIFNRATQRRRVVIRWHRRPRLFSILKCFVEQVQCRIKKRTSLLQSERIDLLCSYYHFELTCVYTGYRVIGRGRTYGLLDGI
jgi:hypothetical protein